MPPTLAQKASGFIEAADGRDSKNAANHEAYKPDDLSRTLGGQLRREVKIRAPVNVDIRVQLRDPQTTKVIEDLGVLRLEGGIGSISLSDAQHQKIVETIWPVDFVSPTVSGGARRNWLFPYEWKRCEINVHGAKP